VVQLRLTFQAASDARLVGAVGTGRECLRGPQSADEGVIGDVLKPTLIRPLASPWPADLGHRLVADVAGSHVDVEVGQEDSAVKVT